MKHVAGLDGLRGAAVAGVLLFHSGGALRGGYLGVDLFFVLSGYLITTILLDERRARGRIDFLAFWVRRARRLLPALLSLMPAIALYAWKFAEKNELASIRGDALATLAYVANWRAIFVHRSYWELFAAPSPLEHTWSLAIEEQFYVVWPALVAGVLWLARARKRTDGARALLAVCVALAIASAVTMLVVYGGDDTTRAYLGTDTRGAAILIGASLAAFASGRTFAPSRALDVVGLVALAGMGVAWARLDGENPFLYRGGFWLTEIGAVLLVACCVFRPAGAIARIFSVRPLRALGAISYGVYLWHWPLFVVLSEERLHVHGVRLFALRVAATLAIAIVSYRFLERPIRQSGLRARPVVVVPSAFALAALMIVFATRNVAAKTENAPVTSAPLELPKEIKFPPVNTFPLPAALPPNAVRALVVGDSVGISLGSRMYWVRRPADPFVVQRSRGDCSILDGVVPVHSMSGWPHGNGNCATEWENDVKELEPDVVLVVLGGAYFSKVKSRGAWRNACDRGWSDAYEKKLASLLRAMAPHTKRLVVALAAYPVGKWQKPGVDDLVDCYDKTLVATAKDAGADVLDVNAYLCPNKECVLESRNDVVRPDGLHFGATGADDVSHWTLDALKGSRTP
ncbi:MAG TPA: acyltransferase family protein [Polyangiaceae bacterium]